MSKTTSTAADDAVQPVATWHLTVAYDGTRYRGWQVQPAGPTVQEEIQSRLRRLLRCPDLRIAATSRTDAGVHALDQQVSFRAPVTADMDSDAIRLALNKWLPDDIRINAVRKADDDFHARYSAVAKAYTYVIHRGEKCDPLFVRYCWHHRWPLAVESMRRAAVFLVGRHDFSSFAVNPKKERESKVRTVHNIDVTECGEYI